MSGILRTNGGPTRRKMLQAGLGWTAWQSASKNARAGADGPRSDRTLVLLHLSGGNDGLNTLIPYADPMYYELRPRLSRAACKAIAINEHVAFHPSLSALVPTLERGCLAVVQGVGHPDPDYSHVGACRIWAAETTAALGSRTGIDLACRRGRSPASNPLEYRPGQIEETLAEIVRLAGSSRRPALISATVGGFDTHADQLEAHEVVLRELGDGLAKFQRELERQAIAERVVLAAWSEFGRRPVENAMGGTDHGTAGPVLLLGTNVRGGLHGAMPSLEETDFGNLIPSVDVRTIYDALATSWLGASAPAPSESLMVLTKGCSATRFRA